ncbi:uncharacterized protein LOC115879568 [Sitophilus oryzae]|uniref:Transcription initiation factor TFIID subunit 6 n=1 Tax=Sitophilus oryzae TaxID=7048 RepID=A0A6J2XN93_SITOR|nr:uncharacterized protein LOC115879568 [Sitophilus oryzae]
MLFFDLILSDIIKTFKIFECYYCFVFVIVINSLIIAMNSSSSSSGGSRHKKQAKMGNNKIQSVQSQQDNTSNEEYQEFPSKYFQGYAGIGPDSIKIYAEQNNIEENFTEEMYNILTEDINYKLRYIIHNALIKAKLQHRETITSGDIEETFANLNIDKVYGASSNPNWLRLPDDSLFFLDDQQVNLVEIAEEQMTYMQEGDTVISQVWLSANDTESTDYTQTFTNYFKVMCKSLVSNNEELRRMALKDISENASIGPITNWFYNFSYFILKDIKYESLTLKILQLLEVLENSPLPSLQVSTKQLKLLTNILCGRLLKSEVPENVLSPMCYVLSLLCLRLPLKKYLLNKIKQKIFYTDKRLILLAIIYFLGIDAVSEVFRPNMSYLLVDDLKDERLTEVILSIYGLICKANLNTGSIYDGFRNIYGRQLTPFFIPNKIMPDEQVEMKTDFVTMKVALMKTRRNISKIEIEKFENRNKKTSHRLDDFFEIPENGRNLSNRLAVNERIKFKKIEKFTLDEQVEMKTDFVTMKVALMKTRRNISKIEIEKFENRNKKTSHRLDDSFEIPENGTISRNLSNRLAVIERIKCNKIEQLTIGKFSFSILVLKSNKRSQCIDHTLFNYNL